MSSPYINYDNRLTGGACVSGIVSSTLMTWYQLKRLTAEMDSVLGSPPVWANLEPMFGLSAGTGEAFYNTVVGLRAALDTACLPLANLDKVA